MSALPNLWHDEGSWRPHDGGDCPIPRDAIVRLQFRCGRASEKEYRAGHFIWHRRGWDFDVVGYKVVGVGDE